MDKLTELWAKISMPVKIVLVIALLAMISNIVT